MNRLVEPEMLDELAPADPRATRSRRDLRRLNAWMGHARIMAGALARTLEAAAPQRIADLGGGDGRFLLSVAKSLRGRWPTVDAVVVDRLEAFDHTAEREFLKLGWRVRPETVDVRTWLESHRGSREGIVTNLFLHQFTAGQLGEMLGLAAEAAPVFVAVEPRRGPWPWGLSRMLGLIGFGEVTCNDAPVSVRAGFRGHELAALWPDAREWVLTERRAGLFSHLFIAQRRQ